MAKGIGQHKQMAMGGGSYKKGGSVKPPMNFGSPKTSNPIPKDGFSETPTEKVKRVNGVKGV